VRLDNVVLTCSISYGELVSHDDANAIKRGIRLGTPLEYEAIRMINVFFS
jgi:hypothetical protein